MDIALVQKAVVAMAPVVALLLVFDRLDVFNLISFKLIAALTVAGGAVAAASFFVNWRVMDGFPIGFSAHSRYVSPPIEEALKTLPVIALFAMNRIGFKLDAAIAGFAVGAGFSVVENGFYLREFSDANLSAWLVRGFGTAIMHGGATALFAVVAHEMTERQNAGSAARYRFNPLLFLPGLAVAILAHSLFNHFPGRPLAAMVVTLVATPLALFVILTRSERATHAWLKDDRVTHEAMLKSIRDGAFRESEAGRAIHALTDRFDGVRANEVFAYVELKTELVLRAEELLLTRQHYTAADVTDHDSLTFAEYEALKKKLGRPVVAAVEPYLGFSRNDLWELGRLRARVTDKAD